MPDDNEKPDKSSGPAPKDDDHGNDSKKPVIEIVDDGPVKTTKSRWWTWDEFWCWNAKKDESTESGQAAGSGENQDQKSAGPGSKEDPKEDPRWKLPEGLPNMRVFPEHGLIISGSPQNYDEIPQSVWKIINCQGKEKALEMVANSGPNLKQKVIYANPNHLQSKRWFRADEFQNIMQSLEVFMRGGKGSKKVNGAQYILVHDNGGRNRSPVPRLQFSLQIYFSF